MRTIVREKYDAFGNFIGREIEHIYDDQPSFVPMFPMTIPQYPQFQPIVTCGPMTMGSTMLVSGTFQA